MNDKKSPEEVVKRIFPVISLLASLIAFTIILDTFNLDLYSALYNIFFLLPIFGLFLMITRRFHLATFLTTIATFILYYIDQYVFSSRLTHIRFSDIKLISQAARVANRYFLIWNAEITRRLALSLLICAFLFIIFYYYKLKYSWKSAFYTGLGIFVISGAVILSGVIPCDGQEDFDFTADAERQGLLYSWYCQAKRGKLKAPEGYSKEKAEKILKQYEASEGADDIRLIVIMNESLTDYSLIGTPYFEDPLPYIHSLVDSGEAFEGKLIVSVFGGGTANTEYEFLTGNSTAFLPEGSTPYLQYVTNYEDNLASELKNQSYRSIAIHPYYSEEWNRSQVYRFFGFDKFISGVDFGSTVIMDGESATAKVPYNKITFGEGPLYIRGLISDQTCYERVIDECVDKSFIFALTMQNHGGYDYKGSDFEAKEYVTTDIRKEWTEKPTINGVMYGTGSNNINEEVDKVNQYLTLSNISDQAFEILVEELRKSDQKTMVLMFGDHQPGLLISEHYVEAEKGADLDYTIPYIMWANYDIEFDVPEVTSPNYVSAILKKNAGLDLSAWDQFRLEMMKSYPVVTTNYVLNKDLNEADLNELKNYEHVQYMRMFD